MPTVGLVWNYKHTRHSTKRAISLNHLIGVSYEIYSRLTYQIITHESSTNQHACNRDTIDTLQHSTALIEGDKIQQKRRDTNKAHNIPPPPSLFLLLPHCCLLTPDRHMEWVGWSLVQ